jgi:hypothetical protein
MMPVFMFFYSVILSEAKNPLHAGATSGFERSFRHHSPLFLLRDAYWMLQRPADNFSG